MSSADPGRAIRYVSVLLHNAIPLAGAIFFGWSAVMLLALFWCDNVLNSIFNVVRIVAYWQNSDEDLDKPHRFEWIGPKRTPIGLLSGFVRRALTALAFSAVVLIVAFVSFEKRGLAVRFDPRQLVVGVLATALIGIAELLIDLPSLRRRSFLWLEWRVWSSDPTLFLITLFLAIPVAIWFGTASAALVILVLINIAEDFASMAIENAKARLWPAGWDE